MISMNFIMITISMLISVTFYTILERKILSYTQTRKGPNKVGITGILQPFSDAIKLFNKTLISPEHINMILFYLSPGMAFTLSLTIIPLLLFNHFPLFDIKHSILLFFILSSMLVYSILLIGWSSNSKFAYMGSIRSIAQMISYEISFFLIILFTVILSKSYSLTQIKESQTLLYFIFGNLILFSIWMISLFAETNRSPFDFAESESELVSGFNVEYMGGWFALIFLAEYLSMLILSMITTILFFKAPSNLISYFILILITISLIWVRATHPRFRYDMLMHLSWKIFLPLSLYLIPLSLVLAFFFY